MPNAPVIAGAELDAAQVQALVDLAKCGSSKCTAFPLPALAALGYVTAEVCYGHDGAHPITRQTLTLRALRIPSVLQAAASAAAPIVFRQKGVRYWHLGGATLHEGMPATEYVSDDGDRVWRRVDGAVMQ